MLEYRLKLPKQQRLFNQRDLIFIINHIRSRRPSIIYFIFHCYDVSNDEILISDNPVYTSPRFVVDTGYNTDGGEYVQSFSIPNGVSDINNIFYTQIEIRALNVDSENPLYFNQLMLQEDDGTGFHEYHTPNEYINHHTIELPSNLYANLYDDDGNYLQVIRPNKESFSTNILDKAQYTILAPHFLDDDGVDGHVEVFLEALNQTEQRIDVLR